LIEGVRRTQDVGISHRVYLGLHAVFDVARACEASAKGSQVLKDLVSIHGSSGTHSNI
jgi:hypothetical protein